MSPRAQAVGRKAEVEVLAAITLYPVWTLATWLLEGRTETLLRPDATGDRVIYTIVANLLIGIIAAIVILRHLIRERTFTKLDVGFGPFTPSPMRLVIAAGLGFALYALQGVPSWHPVVLINAFAHVRPSGRQISLLGAALVASILFGVYHFAHSAPFNTIGKHHPESRRKEKPPSRMGLFASKRQHRNRPTFTSPRRPEIAPPLTNQ